MNYAEPVKSGILEFKYAGKRNKAAFFARELVKRRGREIMEVSPEVLIPVPIHKSRMKKRGYNQALLLAKELSRYTGIPVDDNILKRVTKTLPQKKLGNAERQNNIKSAFISTSKIVKYKKVMLVDDIYTSGATIEACTGVLMQKGVSEVYYTSICIGRSR